MRIIGIVGQKRNGKDFVADNLKHILKSYYNIDSVNFKFADGIKDFLCEFFKTDRNFIEHWKEIANPAPNFNLPMRTILQLFGETFKQARPDIWIEKIKEKIENVEESQVVIISDVRFCKELSFINDLVYNSDRSYRNYNLLVYRPEFRNFDDVPSENQIGKFIDIYNGVLIEDLEPKVIRLFKSFNDILINDSSEKDFVIKIVNMVNSDNFQTFLFG